MSLLSAVFSFQAGRSGKKLNCTSSPVTSLCVCWQPHQALPGGPSVVNTLFAGRKVSLSVVHSFLLLLVWLLLFPVNCYSNFS